jgi:hypothetical protein
VKISRAAMKAAQEAAKAAKAPVKGKKNNIFIISKSISCKTGAFFYLICPETFRIISNLNFSKTHYLFIHISCLAIHFISSIFVKKKGFSLLSGLQHFIILIKPFIYSIKFIIISLTNHLIKFIFTLCLNGYYIFIKTKEDNTDL